jgi:hypothetical protein
MTDQIVLTVPEDISARARKSRNDRAVVEQVLIDYLKTLAVPCQRRLKNRPNSMRFSIYPMTLVTMPRAMPTNTGTRPCADGSQYARPYQRRRICELELLVQRADRLMRAKGRLRYLRQRGYFNAFAALTCGVQVVYSSPTKYSQVTKGR